MLLLLLGLLTGVGPPTAGTPVTAASSTMVSWRVAGSDSVDRLSAAQLGRYAARRAGSSAAARTDLDRLIATAPPVTRDYVIAAFAAGHSLAEVRAFAITISGQDERWLRTRLRPVDPTEPGTVHFQGNSISQYGDTTCGSTAIVVARTLTDPLYALRLTTGGRPGAGESDERFQGRLRAEEQRVHDATNLLWPQPVGTPPWGVRDQMNRSPAGLGARYQWVPLLPAMPRWRDAVISRALTAASRGYPVPVLIGDRIPRHYVLLLRHGAAGAWFYEPTEGEILLVPEHELRRGDLSALGYARLMGAILPS